jgi:tellurite resistance protein
MSRTHSFPLVPASFFGMVLGLLGLGTSWRAASAVWGAPRLIGELILLAGVLVWLTVLLLYIAKWFIAPKAAQAEADHPVQGLFIGLAGVATTLASSAILPYSRPLAEVLFVVGSLFTVGFAVWRTGELWKGERDPNLTTPVLYLPTVAGGFVTAIAAVALGHQELGQLAFGAALLSWLAIESVLLQRLFVGSSLPPALRPALGIQLAPPAVGGVAAISIIGDGSNLVPLAMFGYALLQALVLLRLLSWIREQPFNASYWGFSFGATAVATLSLRLIEYSHSSIAVYVAPILFIAANVVMATLVVGTI